MFEFNATFLVAMFSFVVFIMIMNMIFYKPILGIIEERENLINNNYNDAKKSTEKAQNLLDDKEKRLDETLKTSRKIITDKTREVNEASNKLLAEAKQKSKNEIQTAKDNLKTQEKSIDLTENIEELSDNIYKKLLGDV